MRRITQISSVPEAIEIEDSPNPTLLKRRPKSSQLQLISAILQGYTLLSAVGIPLTNLILSYHLSESGLLDSFFLDSVMCLYFTFSVICNWYLLKRNNIPASFLLDEDAGPLYCGECHYFVNQKTHHCPLCNICVVDRDHHCFFFGTCVSKRNVKYFICICLHAGIGCALILAKLVTYCNLHYKPLLSSEIFYYIVPIALMKWLEGKVELMHFVSVTLLYSSFSVVLCSVVYFIFQMWLIVRGQTRHEYWSGKKAEGWPGCMLRNVRSMLGSNFICILLFPQLSRIYCLVSKDVKHI